MPAVLLDNPEHHRQTQPGATFTFGREERLEHALLDLSAHANARIDDLDDALPVLVYLTASTHATRRQRIDRVEDEIGHQLAQPRRRALNTRMPGWPST